MCSWIGVLGSVTCQGYLGKNRPSSELQARRHRDWLPPSRPVPLASHSACHCGLLLWAHFLLCVKGTDRQSLDKPLASCGSQLATQTRVYVPKPHPAIFTLGCYDDPVKSNYYFSECTYGVHDVGYFRNISSNLYNSML